LIDDPVETGATIHDEWEVGDPPETSAFKEALSWIDHPIEIVCNAF